MISVARTFLQLAGMMFRQGVTYRLEWLFGVFYGLLVLWVQVAVWQALLGSGGAAAAASPVTARGMVTYLVVARVVTAIVNGSVSRDMETRLRSGDIVHDLLRPTGFPVLVLGRSLGQTAAGVLSRFVPVAVLAHLIWGLQPPASLTGLLAALGTVVVATVISYAIGYLLGILGFWVWTTEHFEWLVGALIQILSGAAVPFWFMPGWLRTIGGALPFHMMGYTPVALYLGKVSEAEAMVLLTVGCAWAVALWALAWLWWRRAILRLVIQGG
jgi:ABC-2 type transport system permease protein